MTTPSVYEDLLVRGWNFEHTIVGKNMNVRGLVLRIWMHDLLKYQKESDTGLELLRLWGVALKGLLQHTQPEHVEDDSRLLGHYLSNICRLDEAILVQKNVPEDKLISNIGSHKRSGLTANVWWEKPLFKQTHAILAMLARKAVLGPVLCHSVENNLFSLDNLFELLVKSDTLLFPKGFDLFKSDETGQGALLACIPTLLCQSAWRPDPEKMKWCAASWVLADASGEMKTKLDRIEACKNAFPESAAHQLAFLLHCAKSKLDSVEIETLFPLHEPGLLERKGAGYLVHLFLHSSKYPQWEYTVKAFKKHHPDLTALVEMHLSICPDGQPLDTLTASFAQRIHGVVPDVFSIENLGL